MDRDVELGKLWIALVLSMRFGYGSDSGFVPAALTHRKMLWL